MVTINDIKEFIESKRYSKLLYFVQKELNLDIDTTLPSAASRDIYVNELRFSGLSLIDLETTLDEFNSIKNMVALNLKYAEDEDEDVILPFYKDFLISYLIFFYLIKNLRDELLPYLNKLGYSHPAREKERLINLYNQALRD